MTTPRIFTLKSLFLLGCIILVLAIFSVVAMIGIFTKTDRKTAGNLTTVKSSNSPKSEELRDAYIRELLNELKSAIRKNDFQKINYISNSIAKFQIEALPLIEVALEDKELNFTTKLLEILQRIRSAKTIELLERYIAGLSPADKILKVEAIRTINKIGGLKAREILSKVLATEQDKDVKAFIEEHLTGKKDKPTEPTQPTSPVKIEQVNLEKIDLKTTEGFEKIKYALSSNTSIGTKLLALKKISQSYDNRAVDLLATIIKKDAISNEDRFIQTNAIASLARMRTNYARLTLKDLAIDSPLELKFQIIDLIGGYGDRVMIPLLEEIAKKEPKTETNVKKAIAQINIRDKK
jgi:hypothetical protein